MAAVVGEINIYVEETVSNIRDYYQEEMKTDQLNFLNNLFLFAIAVLDKFNVEEEEIFMEFFEETEAFYHRAFPLYSDENYDQLGV